MLNPFPIQFLALFAYFLLRLFLGSVLLYLGFKHFRNRETLRAAFTLSWFPFGSLATWVFITAEVVTGTLLVLGAYTQYAALIVILMSLKMFIMRNHFIHPAIPQRLFYILLLGASLSLFITGAGVLAFDLPI